MDENYIELFRKFTDINDSAEISLLAEVASALILNRKFDEFQKILEFLESTKLTALKKNEKFLRAMIAYHYEKDNYQHVIDLLQTGEFSDYVGLIDIWDEAHYSMKEIQIGKPLTPLIKFRTRQKFPPPINISPSGERGSKKLPDGAKQILKTWMAENAHNPYPIPETREELAQKAGLTHYQVKTWFANARRRQKILAERKRKSKHRALKGNDFFQENTMKKFKCSLNSQTVDNDDISAHSDVNRKIEKPQDAKYLFQVPFHETESKGIQCTSCVNNLRPFWHKKTQSGNSESTFCSKDLNGNVIEQTPIPSNPVASNCLQQLSQLCRNISSNEDCSFRYTDRENVSRGDTKRKCPCCQRNDFCTGNNYLPRDSQCCTCHPYRITMHPHNFFNGNRVIQYPYQNLVPVKTNMMLTEPNLVQHSPATPLMMPAAFVQNNKFNGLIQTPPVVNRFTDNIQSNVIHPQRFVCNGPVSIGSYCENIIQNDKGLFSTAAVGECKEGYLNGIDYTKISTRPMSCPGPSMSTFTSFKKDEFPMSFPNKPKMCMPGYYQQTLDDTTLLLPEGTEEQDVAKVLLDLSSQNSSSQESS